MDSPASFDYAEQYAVELGIRLMAHPLDGGTAVSRGSDSEDIVETLREAKCKALYSVVRTFHIGGFNWIVRGIF